MNPLGLLYRFADHLRYLKHHDLGQRGEDIAHRYLRARGFLILARNWRPPEGAGEIDIIARDGGCLVFVEVKTRAAGAGSAPERGIDSDKIDALRRAARAYIRRSNPGESEARFDTVAIAGNAIDYLRDAFPAEPARL